MFKEGTEENLDEVNPKTGAVLSLTDGSSGYWKNTGLVYQLRVW